MAILSEINIYPIKSLGGIRLHESLVEERGLQHDRRWMLVDAQHQFLTQRKYPRMALCKTALEPHGIRVSFPGLSDLLIPFEPQTRQYMPVTVWGDTCQAVVVLPEANGWFQQALEMDCQLVYMPEEATRTVDPEDEPSAPAVSFADGFPFLMISEASLADLNHRLAEPVPMNRFRPNLVVQQTDPYAEDHWRDIQIGEARFRGVKRCGRCVLTTVNQDTAEKGKEPLKTLASYRTVGNKVLFGQNLIYQGRSRTIKVGDPVVVEPA